MAPPRPSIKLKLELHKDCGPELEAQVQEGSESAVDTDSPSGAGHCGVAPSSARWMRNSAPHPLGEP